MAHRDLKLANALLFPRGAGCPAGAPATIKLGDLGLGVHASQLQRQPPGCAGDAPKGRPGVCHDVVGTPSTMAPEVVREEPHDPYAADAWSLGTCVLTLVCWTLSSTVGSSPSHSKLERSSAAPRCCPRCACTRYTLGRTSLELRVPPVMLLVLLSSLGEGGCECGSDGAFYHTRLEGSPCKKWQGQTRKSHAIAARGRVRDSEKNKVARVTLGS